MADVQVEGSYRGLGGIFGDNSEILFFILIFLCLFYSWGCGKRTY